MADCGHDDCANEDHDGYDDTSISRAAESDGDILCRAVHILCRSALVLRSVILEEGLPLVSIVLKF